MSDKLIRLDEEPTLILTYIGSNWDKYNIDENGKLYINNSPLAPFGIDSSTKYSGIHDGPIVNDTLEALLKNLGLDMERRDEHDNPLFNNNHGLFF